MHVKKVALLLNLNHFILVFFPSCAVNVQMEGVTKRAVVGEI